MASQNLVELCNRNNGYTEPIMLGKPKLSPSTLQNSDTFMHTKVQLVQIWLLFQHKNTTKQPVNHFLYMYSQDVEKTVLIKKYVSHFLGLYLNIYFNF